MSVEFEALLQEKAAALEADWQIGQNLQADCTAVLKAAFSKIFPRRRWSMEKATEIPDLEILRAPFQEKANAWVKARQALEAGFDERLRKVAQEQSLPRTDGLNLLETISGSRHHTQGFGASKYARSDALQMAAVAVAHGLRAEVRPVNPPRTSRDSVTYQDFGVFADTTEAGYKMLEYRPRPPLRDMLQTILRAGTNPRVFYPFLPWGTEERLGLDAYGDDVPGWRPPEVPKEEAEEPAPDQPGGP